MELPFTCKSTGAGQLPSFWIPSPLGVFTPPSLVLVHSHHLTMMDDPSYCPPLTRASVQEAHERIKQYIRQTPVATCETLNQIASRPQSERCPNNGPNTAAEPAPHTTSENSSPASYTARPNVKLFFKCENQQRIGAFKARGAFHALGRLIDAKGIDDVRSRGVCTHSSGNVHWKDSSEKSFANRVQYD